VVFGIVGYLMIRLQFPRLTLVIALVLGNLAEVSYFQSFRILGGDWTALFSRPPVVVLAALIVVSLSVPAIQTILRQRKAGRHVPADAPGDAPADSSADAVPASRGEWAFSAFVLVFIVGYLFESYTYDEDERTVPLLAAWSTLAIFVLDVLVMSNTRVGRIVAIVFPRVGGPLDQSPAKLAASLFAWFTGLGVGIYLVGFLITIPLYVIASLMLRGRKPFRTAAIFAASVFAVIWIVFEWLMGYELYRGVLFGAY
jgi:hypothetical protein